MKTRSKNRYNVIVRREPGLAKCPSCGKFNELRRSKGRNAWENFIRSTTIWKVYRCNACGWRGYMSTYALTWQSLRNFFYYLLLALASGLIVREVVKRIAT